jgi:hypothetical protein
LSDLVGDGGNRRGQGALADQQETDNDGPPQGDAAMTPDQLAAAGFVEGADHGFFFTRTAAGTVASFGVRQRDEAAYLKETIVTIDWVARTASRADRTVTSHPHPDADPTITLDQTLANWLDELVAGQRFVQACAFCGKQSHEVARLIAGPTAMICNECVALCQEVLATD